MSFDEQQVKTFVYEKNGIDGPSNLPHAKQFFTEYVFLKKYYYLFLKVFENLRIDAIQDFLHLFNA